ncbi:MAG: hypothetical protein AAGF12_22375 [Myxococcota bacterium]
MADQPESASSEDASGGKGTARSRIAPAYGFAAAFAVYGVVAIVEDLHLNDEGLLTYYFAAMAGEAPLDVLFFMKSRPVVSLVFLPVAALGLDAFLIAHVLGASLAVVLVSMVAEALGHRRPWIAGAIMATSPLYLAGAPAGISNVDAVVGVCLSVLLLVRGRPGGAAAVAGALLLVRSELAIFVGALGVFLLWSDRRHRRAIAFLPAVPLVYVALGAMFHRAPLWALSFPPALTGAPPGSPHFDEGYGGELGSVGAALLAVTPALGLVGAVSWGRLLPIERAILGYAAVLFLFLVGFPFLGWFNFDDAPRYLLPMLPAVALLVSRALSDPTPWRGGDALVLAGGFVLGLLAYEQHRPELLWAVVPWAGLIAVRWGSLAARRFVSAVPTLAVLFLLGASPLLMPATEILPAKARLEALLAACEGASAPVCATNAHLLRTYGERSGRDVERVRYLLQMDQRYELETLTNPEVGQRARIFELLDAHFYAPPIDFDALPEGSLIVVEEDARFTASVPAHFEATASEAASNGGDAQGIQIFHWRER